MTVRDTDIQLGSTPVRVRGTGDVDDRALCVRTEVDAVLGRSGPPPVSGEVRIANGGPAVGRQE
ncbi:hypothetical protein ACWGBH_35615 [Streptomyces massasporeus]